jgi:hypothetical protein
MKLILEVLSFIFMSFSCVSAPKYPGYLGQYRDYATGWGTEESLYFQLKQEERRRKPGIEADHRFPSNIEVKNV